VGPGIGRTTLEAFINEGAAARRRIEALLPVDWSFEGKRVLDFGCGAGRVLRHFLDEAESAEFWGCDIDRASIEWLRENLSPPLHCFENGYAPPLELHDGSIDLVWATSVFTHIGDLWAHWLLELHRILVPDGLLIASFLGEGMWEARVREPYQEDEVGMTVVGHWRGPDADVLHSEWWLREHWGRAFEVLDVVRPTGAPDGSPPVAHSHIVLRRKPGRFSVEDLEYSDPGDPRELAALKTTLRVQRYEIAVLAAKAPLVALARDRAREALLGSRVAAPARRLRRRLR
jgi:SAM-dependent methyltransferase